MPTPSKKIAGVDRDDAQDDDRDAVDQTPPDGSWAGHSSALGHTSTSRTSQRNGQTA